mmetsp:Transcript_27135/g.75847  ORF Transcript_27135/g.75847 Transcript_27135/m.75847 type:complete len:217 (-) Transcript_27135:97-747(-)
MRADDAGRAAEDQGRAGPDTVVPAVLPGGDLRELRNEHQRVQRAGVPHRGGARGGGCHHRPAAPHVRGEGPRGGHVELLFPVQEHQALAARGGGRQGGGQGALPVQGGPREAGRPVRVHPVRLLLHVVPVVLVEQRQVPGPGGAAAGLPLDHRQPRHGHAGAHRARGRCLQAVPVQDHHELRQGLPQGPQPGQSHRQDQEGHPRRARVRHTAALEE